MATRSYKKYFDLEKIIKNIKDYLPSFSEKKFMEAFNFAEKAHRGQFRKDGKTPYLAHPISVVNILAEMHADEDILISALLHDVPEDTKFTLEEIKKLFGEKISFLVDSVTKFSKVHYQQSMSERQIESLKKFFLYSTKDPRGILIKLADRLHNMCTLQNIEKPEKRVRIAKETLEIYVPIANLLGIQEFKSELEDLCFKHLFPTEYSELFHKTEESKKENKSSVSKFIRQVKSALKENKIEAEIYKKKRNLYSLYKEMCSFGKTIKDIETSVTIRIIVSEIAECYQTLGIIHGKYVPKTDRFRDYIANPKSNGYQSLHTSVFGADGLITDVQIRTKGMHLEAEYGIAANFFNHNQPETDKDKRYYWVDQIAEVEKASKENEDFIEKLKLDIFQDRIVIFTLKGVPIDLPKGASIIDFAYAIDPDIGEHSLRAEINGNVFPVITTLKTGDVVNVITSKDVSPELYWLSFAQTNFARSKIKEYLSKVSLVDKIRVGHQLLQKEFDIAGLGVVNPAFFKKIKTRFSTKFGRDIKTLDDLFTGIGEGNVRAIDVVKEIKKPHLQQVTLNLKIVAKNRFGLLRDIYEVLYKYSSNMNYLKGWAAHKYEDAYFSVQIVLDSMDVVGKIFDELEQIDGIKYVYRISYAGVYLTYFLALITVALWVMHPIVLRIFSDLQLIDYHSIVYQIITNAGLLVLFGLVLYLTHVTKKYFPLARNKTTLWIFAFSLPILATIPLLVEILYFKLELSWIAILIEIAMVYAYLGISFVTFKKQI
ncbi:bifunctional (p)ppGpp synthetase/guanosine-3',5'-bis(diphosphate) 3'-pyrophosphohydrolase [Candidatus Peregrinibacteria bacterium]|nr:bifunctional (p)ppGpp synthetase/guanosine-3',5'-bis(diphosphate) 3'-pyrophosphohydrolase [Candidatus Peregrinibacteria bacterium]